MRDILGIFKLSIQYKDKNDNLKINFYARLCRLRYYLYYDGVEKKKAK